MPTIIISVEDVLLTTDFSKARPDGRLKLISHTWGGFGKERFLLRPYALEFIETIRSRFDNVYAIDDVCGELLSSRISAAGMTSYFDGILGEEDMALAPYDPCYDNTLTCASAREECEVCLIDVAADDSAAKKMRMCGAPVWDLVRKCITHPDLLEDQTFVIEPFVGDPNDSVLLKVSRSFLHTV